MATDKFENFFSALSQLEQYLAVPVVTDRDRAGIIQGFEFTFETCWKSFQRNAEIEGLQVNSPRQAFQAALQLGLIEIEDEETWLAMIADRNLTSHVYRRELATRIVKSVTETYLPLFQSAKKKLQKLAKPSA